MTRGWSQERLALECDLDRTYVSAVERSRWNVSLGNIVRMAQALDVQPWELLYPAQQNMSDVVRLTAADDYKAHHPMPPSKTG